MRKWYSVLLAAVFVLTALFSMPAFDAGNAMADDSERYPSRPIRMIVPFSPGGSADALARTIQPALVKTIGQKVVMDNRPGASSTIGAGLTAKADPDGYTVLLITTTHTVNPSLMAKMPFDPIKDFTAVTVLVAQPNILAVHPSVPAKTVKELVALAKSKPDTLNFASGGNGSSPHLSGELLNIVAGTKIVHVPYKGSGPGVTELIGGHVQMMFAGPLAFYQHIQSGRLRALAIADTSRLSMLPDVPTMSEAGFPGVETGTWYAILGPAGIPKEILTKINGAFAGALQMPETKSRLLNLGVKIISSSPEECERYMIEEVARYSKIIKQAGISVR